MEWGLTGIERCLGEFTRILGFKGKEPLDGFAGLKKTKLKDRIGWVSDGVRKRREKPFIELSLESEYFGWSGCSTSLIYPKS